MNSEILEQLRNSHEAQLRSHAAQMVERLARQEELESLAILAEYVASDPDPALCAALAAAAQAGEPGGFSLSNWDPDTANALLELFRHEALEHLDACDKALRSMEMSGVSSVDLDAIFRKVHTVKGSAATVGLQIVGQAAHRYEESLALLRGRGEKALPSSFRKALDLLRVMVQTASIPQGAPVLLTHLSAILQRWDAPVRQGTTVERRLWDRRDPDHTMVRVPVEGLDGMTDLIGETVVLRARLEHRVDEFRRLAAGVSGDAAKALAQSTAWLLADVESLRQVSAGLQERVSRLRLLSARLLFRRVLQPLQEAARSLGKDVAVEVAGEDVELDRALIAPVGEVLIHLVRNAVVHGIEPPAVRVARGKPPQGHIRLAARKEGTQITLEVSDDGAGIDPNRIRQALVAEERLTEAEARDRSDAAILGYIFEPGFSTQNHADTLAGRGMGLDAVRVAIGAIGGEVWVESAIDCGARFVIRLPLNSAIVDALLFKVGGQVYALLAAQVVETGSVPLQPRNRSGEPLRVGDRRLPWVSLPTLLGGDLAAKSETATPVIVVRYGEREFALTCHKIVGTRQILMRGLGPLLERLPLYMGGTVSGAGKVQLVLDCATLCELAFSAGSASSFPASGASFRLLFVDDSAAVRESIAAWLGQAGFVVETAEDGEQAWELLQTRHFDLLVTDLEMPRLSGKELIARCLHDEALEKLPVVVLTSRDTAANRASSLAHGASAFVPKSLYRKTLIPQILEALKKDK